MNIDNRDPFDNGIHEECGVFGVFGVENAASLTYYGLHSLQHRGQEGCGIVSVSDSGEMLRRRGEGLVTEVFNEANLSPLKGRVAIGHVRYSTSGGNEVENIQPFVFHHNTGNFAMAHNGNIVNADDLRLYLENKGSLFQSSSDSEVLAHLIKKNRRTMHRIDSIVDALNMIEGAFSFLIMTENRIYACRDKYGLRPLCIGKLGDGYVFSSESCALDVVGAGYVRDVEPGEIVSLMRKRDSAQPLTHTISVVICVRWSISILRVLILILRGVMFTLSARSRVSCFGRVRLRMLISWWVFPTLALVRQWAMPRRRVYLMRWDL